MTENAVQMRLEKLMETDWRVEAAILLKTRIAKGESMDDSETKPYVSRRERPR